MAQKHWESKYLRSFTSLGRDRFCLSTRPIRWGILQAQEESSDTKKPVNWQLFSKTTQCLLGYITEYPQFFTSFWIHALCRIACYGLPPWAGWPTHSLTLDSVIHVLTLAHEMSANVPEAEACNGLAILGLFSYTSASSKGTCLPGLAWQRMRDMWTRVEVPQLFRPNSARWQLDKPQTYEQAQPRSAILSRQTPIRLKHMSNKHLLLYVPEVLWSFVRKHYCDNG